MLQGSGNIFGILRWLLRFAQDFACGLERPQDGSTSTRAQLLRAFTLAQDDKFLLRRQSESRGWVRI